MQRHRDQAFMGGAHVFPGGRLNDADTDPKDRAAAYAQGYEELLDGIIFIDTRALFNLTVGVIDQLLSLDQAKEILFRKGRVEFSLAR